VKGLSLLGSKKKRELQKEESVVKKGRIGSKKG
jgi:hypothetical protein